MFQPTENKVVVKVTSKYIQAVTNVLRLSALQNNTSIDPAEFVNITGEVISLAKTNCAGREYEGVSTNDIYVGDVAIFSYQVIYDILYKAETDKFIFKNMVTYNGEEYFLADIRNIFGVIRGGDIYMINGYVMLEEYPRGIIMLQQSSKKVKGTTNSSVMHIGKPKTNQEPIDVASGDTVYFSPYHPQHYKINDKPFIILRQNQIFGRMA